MRGIVCRYVHKTIHDEMEESLYYSVVSVTDGHHKDDSDDDESDAKSYSSMDLALDKSEAAYLADKRVSMRHLLEMIPDVEVVRLYHLKIRQTERIKVVALLSNGAHVCTCLRLTNCGFTCRHLFCAWESRRDIPFHLSMVRRRWFDDLTTDTTKITYTTKIGTFKDAHVPLRSPNPIEELPIPTLQTLPATQSLTPQMTWGAANASLKTVLPAIQNTRDLEILNRYVQDALQEIIDGTSKTSTQESETGEL
ncbi:hypothetical protein PsorP6_017001 [Peronosclerospora sorghi]|uniref:Uncharacterized protein n=1 Tax=Peronosclerospora sorghi TaxID=230839 RepID=A0ACC0WCP1_9STRA|nr:hypothetical protein PsorP6_017001 [Peronosclerospora sorghi]